MLLLTAENAAAARALARPAVRIDPRALHQPGQREQRFDGYTPPRVLAHVVQLGSTISV